MRHRHSSRRRSDAARASAAWCVAALVVAGGVLMLAAGVIHHGRGDASAAGDAQPLRLTAWDEPVPDVVTATRHTPARPDSRPQTPAIPPALAAQPAATVTTATATFDHRPLRRVRTLGMRVTAYSPDARSCGRWADGQTASGYSVWTNGMNLVAADTDLLPFGTIVTVPGYADGQPVPVLDRGGAIRGHRLDVLYPTHERALQWGVQEVDVTIWEYADE